MAINKDKKKNLIELYIDLINESDVVIFLDTQHLNVKEIEVFKDTLSRVNAKYILIKNTLFKKAFEQSNKEILTEVKDLHGYNACVFFKDNIPSIMKLVSDFVKSNELNINFGILESYIVGNQDIIELSGVFSTEKLISDVLFILNNGISKLIYTINYYNQMLVNTLDSISKSKGGE